jgi:hypothetical protein
MTNTLVPGMRVKVYRNLHGPKGQRTYSVLGPKGRVVAHVTSIMLTDVTFVVRAGGRDRVRKTKRKNVHAFVVGTYAESAMGQLANLDLPAKVVYNPYEMDGFMVNHMLVTGAKACIINQNGISAAYLY